ncbi:MAG: hypothetical protein J07HQW2_03090 [Haloquadratum walsbyi J07HQW2]|uniref:Uncharacterized protein n=1 Tax=Haloquadratum walsbyi J07HQW2 TaxID=1238425 RepID=U1NHF2_9EURY|nr:MAG: hypothetical protein J07HQW2_03090 [Haloquadratum walsbyi J07HQW2]
MSLEVRHTFQDTTKPLDQRMMEVLLHVSIQQDVSGAITSVASAVVRCVIFSPPTSNVNAGASEAMDCHTT